MSSPKDWRRRRRVRAHGERVAHPPLCGRRVHARNTEARIEEVRHVAQCRRKLPVVGDALVERGRASELRPRAALVRGRRERDHGRRREARRLEAGALRLREGRGTRVRIALPRGVAAQITGGIGEGDRDLGRPREGAACRRKSRNDRRQRRYLRELPEGGRHERMARQPERAGERQAPDLRRATQRRRGERERTQLDLAAEPERWQRARRTVHVVQHARRRRRRRGVRARRIFQPPCRRRLARWRLGRPPVGVP